MRRPVRLALGLWLLSCLLTLLPEPCPMTYGLWRWSLKQGAAGVWVRDLIEPSVCTCDAMRQARWGKGS